MKYYHLFCALASASLFLIVVSCSQENEPRKEKLDVALFYKDIGKYRFETSTEGGIRICPPAFGNVFFIESRTPLLSPIQDVSLEITSYYDDTSKKITKKYWSQWDGRPRELDFTAAGGLQKLEIRGFSKKIDGSYCVEYTFDCTWRAH